MPSGKGVDKPTRIAGRGGFGGWRPRSLRTRQLLAASLGLVAFLALAGYALDRAFVSTAEQNQRQRLRSYALAYTEKLDFDRAGEVIPLDVPPDPRLDMLDSGLYAEVVLPKSYWSSTSTLGLVLPESPL